VAPNGGSAEGPVATDTTAEADGTTSATGANEAEGAACVLAGGRPQPAREVMSSKSEVERWIGMRGPSNVARRSGRA
jgi:hypothetical protein